MGMLGSLFFSRSAIFYSPNVYEPLFWTGAIYLLCELLTARRLEPGFGWA